MDLSKASFWGYKRENDRVGVRNHVLILPVDDLSNAAAQAVEHNVKGTMQFTVHFSLFCKPLNPEPLSFILAP